MSILDKASLIQIPSGYKNGKLYSVKPTPTYGSELITNGDFSSDSDWSLGSGWSIGSGLLNAIGAGNYAVQTNVLAQSTNAILKVQWTQTITSGTRLRFFARNYNDGGSETVLSGSATDGGVFSGSNCTGSGTYTIYVSTTNGFSFKLLAESGNNATVDNVSVKQVLVADGDFNFERSSSATRVNSEGLIETAQILGSEEVTNGDFSGGSTGWTITNGTVTDKYNASMTAYQSGIKITPFLKNGTFKVVFDLVITSGNCKFDAGGGNNQTYTTSGTKELTITNPTKFEFNAFNLGWVGTLDNVSVKEVFENDVPRLDYSDGSCASLLLEPQRTNAINHSNDYTQWSNTQFTINSNSVTSPEGITNGTKIIPSTSNTEKFLDKGGFSRTSGQYITHTVYAKASGYNFLYLSNSASRLYAVYDLQQGLVIYNNSNGTDFNNHSASIELLGNGWYRCELIGQAQNTVASYFRISCGTTAINSSTQGLFQGDGTSGIEVYGSQVELNASYSTSYIPTTSATATRTADACNNAGTSATFNSTEGVLFAEIAALANDGTYRMISLSDGTATNRISFFYQNSPINTIAVESAGSGTNLGIYGQSLTITNSNKIAVKYKANDCALWVNGVEVATDTSFAAFSSGTFTKLSFDRGDGLMDFYGKTKQLMVFNEALSDSELATLTTL